MRRLLQENTQKMTAREIIQMIKSIQGTYDLRPFDLKQLINRIEARYKL